MIYFVIRFGGESLKDEDRGIQRMLAYFGNYFTEEQLKKNMEVTVLYEQYCSYIIFII